MGILFIPFALVCAAFFVYEVSQAIMSFQTKKWESCIGELIRWEPFPSVIDGGSLRGFRYKYVVSGKEYESGNIGFGFSRMPGWGSYDAKIVLNKVLVNAPMVTVYYSPDNPQNSVLCTGIQGYHVTKIFGYCVGAIFIMWYVIEF